MPVISYTTRESGIRAEIGCTCSDMQLHLVGCDCALSYADPKAMKLVDVWPRGYAADGAVTLKMAESLDHDWFARTIVGPSACVYAVRPANPAPVAPVSEAYARAMSRNDNS